MSRFALIMPKAAWAASNLARALLYKGDFQHAVLWFLKAKRLKGGEGISNELQKARKLYAAHKKRRHIKPQTSQLP